MDLRAAIEDFCNHELAKYYAAKARHSSSRSQTRKPPKEPSLLADVLDADDWSVIAQYVALLRPLKEATMLLQGRVSTTAKGEQLVKGAIWQVLPIFEVIMNSFEEARQRYLPAETLESQRLQHDSPQPSAPSPPLSTPSPMPARITRSSQSIPIPQTLAPTDGSATPIAPIVAEEQMRDYLEAETFDISTNAESQKHFSTNINLA